MSIGRAYRTSAPECSWLWAKPWRGILRPLGCIVLLILALGLFRPTSAAAIERHPLEPPDTSTPRATLKSFIQATHKSYTESREEGHRSEAARGLLTRASRCLDLSKVAPTVLEDVGLESALLLKEVLDRVGVPSYEEIPGPEEVRAQGLSRWRLPHTEITIGKINEGPREGEFLFTAETVDRVHEFYEKVRDLPYKQEASVDAYENYIFSPGWMIPSQLIEVLPDWAMADFWDQALWQWVGLMVSLSLGGLIVALTYRWSSRKYLDTRDTTSRWQWGRLLFPVSGMLVARLLEYFVDEQINITGSLLEVAKIGLRSIFFISFGWAITVVGNIITEGVITSPRIQAKGIDADLIRLTFRVFVLILVFVLFYHAADYFGLPVTAVFASAGIAGVAVALAARETLANFFGGISIFLDRPFRAGDYIILDAGERGEVREIGMRSTRILTRDDVLISVPNSLITNAKVINESAPESRFRVRIKVNVAYGTDIDELEKMLLDLTQQNPLVTEQPKPRVRFRNFGDSSLEFELLCWAKRPHDKGRLIHELNCGIYKAFDAAGIVIPYPQRDVHMYSHANGSSEALEGKVNRDLSNGHGPRDPQSD